MSSPSPRKWCAKIIEKERPDALLPTMGGQTGLNTGLALHYDGTLEKYGVELIGARAESIEKAEDRLKFRDAMDKIGLESSRSMLVTSMDQAEEALAITRPARDPAPVLYAWRRRRRHLLQPRRIPRHARRRSAPVSGHRSAGRRIHSGLERVRDGSGARQGGQLHHRLLDREHRPDGRPHRRFDHRRTQR